MYYKYIHTFIHSNGADSINYCQEITTIISKKNKKTQQLTEQKQTKPSFQTCLAQLFLEHSQNKVLHGSYHLSLASEYLTVGDTTTPTTSLQSTLARVRPDNGQFEKYGAA